MTNKQPTITYDPEADVLGVKVSDGTLYDTRESGNMIIHMNKDQQPIYVEIMEAGDFLQSSQKSVFDALSAATK